MRVFRPWLVAQREERREIRAYYRRLAAYEVRITEHRAKEDAFRRDLEVTGVAVEEMRRILRRRRPEPVRPCHPPRRVSE